MLRELEDDLLVGITIGLMAFVLLFIIQIWFDII